MRTNSVNMSALKLLFLFYSAETTALLCYNCSANHRTQDLCGGGFTTSSSIFNNTRHYLLNCSAGFTVQFLVELLHLLDNAMCFVRSWTARARHAWIVQRGCYHVSDTDPFPRSMDTPTRAMTCKLERLADAEYKVCLCRADWCNKTPPSIKYINIIKSILYIPSLYVISY